MTDDSFMKIATEPVCRKQITVLGGEKVGKTNIITRYLYNDFVSEYTPTIEDIYREIVTSNRQVMDLVLLDTAGAFQFPAMRRLAISKSDAILIVYSLENYASFIEAKRLHTIVAKTLETKKIPLVLVGNKFDLNDHAVSHNEVLQFLKSMGRCARHFEVSAKDDLNVTYALNTMLEMIKGSEMPQNMLFAQNNAALGKKRISYASSRDVKQRVRLVFQESIHLQEETSLLYGGPLCAAHSSAG